jgi:hypothetical protein
MSALPPKADIVERDWNVRFVPQADILRCGRDRRYSIISSARAVIRPRSHPFLGKNDRYGSEIVGEPLDS